MSGDAGIACLLLMVMIGYVVWALLRDAVTAGVKKTSPADRLAIAQPPAAPPLGDTKACPFCAETIKAAAVVCRFCNRELSADLNQDKQDKRDPIPLVPPKPDVIAVRRFRIAGRDRSGRPVTLTVAARSPVDAAKAAAARGLTVQTCEPVGESAIV